MGEPLLVLLVIALGTYALRAAFLVTAGRRLPAPIARVLPHLGPAVLAAIALPALLAPRGSVALVDTAPALVAAAVAALPWRRTGSLPPALFAGLALSVLARWALRMPHPALPHRAADREAGGADRDHGGGERWRCASRCSGSG